MNSNQKATIIDVESENDIVISGIAGRFPKSNNFRQLEENLFNKLDLGSNEERRWNHGHPDLPQRMGLIDNCEKFDADYFEIPFNEVHIMDPQSRMLMEHTYEAIVDAGINPKDLSGTKTGIFLAICVSEAEKVWFFEKPQIAGAAAFGCYKPLYANRMSHWLNITGPSCTFDSACSSSLIALENAYKSIRTGQCDAAIVGGVNLCMHPYISLQFARLDEECFYIDVLRCESRQSSNDGSMIISATKMHPKELRLLRSEFEDEKKCRLAIMPLIRI
nr:PREDICTED: fatty acid synthase-like [Linepithema humile]